MYAELAYWSGLKRLEAREAKLLPWEVREELAVLEARRAERLRREPGVR
jgi:hypothetical protein